VWYRFASNLKQELFEMSNKKFANPEEFNRYLNDVLKRLDIPPKQLTSYKYILAKCSDLNKTQMTDLVRRLSKMYGSKLQVSRLDNGSLRVNDLILNNSLDFLSAIHAKESKEMRKNDPDGKNEPTVLSGGDGIEIIPIDSEEEAIEVGKRLKFPGTPWCITWKSGNLYMNYRMINNSTFYIIINHNLPTNDDHHAVALRSTDEGLFYTNFSNSNDDMGDGEELLKELGLNPADFPVKPLSEEERVEHEAISEQIEYVTSQQALEDFKKLENIEVNGKILPDVLNHYVQRWPVTKSQLKWLIDTGKTGVINDLVNNDWGLHPNVKALLNKEQLESYTRKKKIVIEALLKEGRNVDEYMNGDDEMMKYIGEYASKNVEKLKENPVINFQYLLKNMDQSKRRDFCWEMRNHPAYNYWDAMTYMPPNERMQFAIDMKDNPRFSFIDYAGYIPPNDVKEFIENMKDHPTFSPIIAYKVTDGADKNDFIKSFKDHPKFDFTSFLNVIEPNKVDEFIKSMKDHPSFNFYNAMKHVPWRLREEYARSMKNHPKFDFGATMRLLPDLDKFQFAAKMQNHPKFNLEDVIQNLPKESADDFLELIGIGADQNGALRKEIEDRKIQEQIDNRAQERAERYDRD